ncbi:Hypothetical predicted protein, partial [Paramuricea clavata]
MAQLIRHQKEDIRGTLLNSSPYKLTQVYTNLQWTQEKWFSMTPEQREAYENAFDKKYLNEKETGYNAIVPAPGSNGMVAFMVESKTSEQPHYVYSEKNGKVTCENCPRWSSAKLCKHSVAVAEKVQNFGKYLDWLRCHNTPHNQTTLVTFILAKALERKETRQQQANESVDKV